MPHQASLHNVPADNDDPVIAAVRAEERIVALAHRRRRRGKGQRLFRSMLFAFLLVAVVFIVGGPLQYCTDIITDRNLDRQLAEAARDVNALAPMTMDIGTTITAAAVDGRNFIYLAQVGLPIRQTDMAAFETRAQRIASHAVCQSNVMLGFIRRGVTIIYRFELAARRVVETSIHSCPP